MNNKLFRYSTEIKIVQSSVKKLNPQFSLCDVLVCYHGDNRNMTSLPKKVIEENLYSIYGVPIIGEWIYKLDGTDEKTWGSHGGRVIIDDNGIHFEQTTKPFGFVTKEAADNASWVTITEKDGHTQNEYLKLSGCILWTDRYEESKTILDENYGQSMEIEFKKGHYREDHYYEAEEFIFSALCILGTDVEPCFESACIGRHYELDSFKQEFSLMLDEYKKLNESATAVHDKETNNNPNKEEKKFMDLEKLNAFLSTFTFKDNCDNDVAKYALLGDATETSFTVIDREDNFKVYTVEFALDDEQNIVADWDAKVEKKFAIVNADEELAIDLNAVIGEYAQSKADMITESLTVSFNEKIDEMAKEYENLSKELETSNKKLADFEAEKAEADRLAHKAEVDAVVAEFAKKIGRSPKFLVYKAKLNADEVTVEKVTQDLTLMAGQEMLGGKSASYSYQPTETKVANKENNDVQNRYGNLLSKYMK